MMKFSFSQKGWRSLLRPSPHFSHSTMKEASQEREKEAPSHLPPLPKKFGHLSLSLKFWAPGLKTFFSLHLFRAYEVKAMWFSRESPFFSPILTCKIEREKGNMLWILCSTSRSCDICRHSGDSLSSTFVELSRPPKLHISVVLHVIPIHSCMCPLLPFA